MGDIYCELGDYAEARHRYQASHNIRRDIGDRQGEGWMLHALAQVDAAQNLYMQAHGDIEQALSIAQECADENLRRACIQVRDQLPTGND